jgi:hypothetical protein
VATHRQQQVKQTQFSSGLQLLLLLLQLLLLLLQLL